LALIDDVIVLAKSQEKSADSERKVPIWDDALSDGKSRNQELRCC
jgi:hypothetical protein